MKVAGGASGGSAQGGEIDDLLRRGASDGTLKGVVAMAASADRVLYAGAAGDRGDGEAMTLDTLFSFASLSKLATSIAALQLVESGRLQLHTPIGALLPELATPQVLEGFDGSGQPILRPAGRPITLHHLLTHTAGYSYEFWDQRVLRLQQNSGLPALHSGRRDALRTPLMFDPGECWLYSIATDWVGLVVEAVCGQPFADVLRRDLLDPLGMTDTCFSVPADRKARLALTHRRQADGSLVADAFTPRLDPEYDSGGGGLYGTASDYLALLRMILRGGQHEGRQILEPRTVAMMAANQIGGLEVTPLASARPDMSNDVDFYVGGKPGWGLATLVDTKPSPHGRSIGTLSWAGLGNTYFWLDPGRDLAGLLLTQILPFADSRVLALNRDFEAATYRLRSLDEAGPRHRFTLGGATGDGTGTLG